jgi:transcriptional regulator with XRE-family HTH domain
MARKSKREVTDELPPLSVAVRRLRAEYGDTLARFSQRLGISMNSVSRFELNKAQPRDPAVLARLCDAASEKGLEHEAALFREAVTLRGDPLQPVYSFSAGAPNLKQWRIATSVRILTAYYPEHMPKLIEALGPALGIVDAVLQTINDPGQIDYHVLDRQVTRLADRQALLELKQGKKER